MRAHPTTLVHIPRRAPLRTRTSLFGRFVWALAHRGVVLYLRIGQWAAQRDVIAYEQQAEYAMQRADAAMRESARIGRLLRSIT